MESEPKGGAMKKKWLWYAGSGVVVLLLAIRAPLLVRDVADILAYEVLAREDLEPW
jgi:hypothetical protein